MRWNVRPSYICKDKYIIIESRQLLQKKQTKGRQELGIRKNGKWKDKKMEKWKNGKNSDHLMRRNLELSSTRAGTARSKHTYSPMLSFAPHAVCFAHLVQKVVARLLIICLCLDIPTIWDNRHKCVSCTTSNPWYFERVRCPEVLLD